MAKRNKRVAKINVLTLLLTVITSSIRVDASKSGSGLSELYSTSSYRVGCNEISAFCRTPQARKKGDGTMISRFSGEMRSCSDDGEMDVPPTVCALLRRARRIREKLYGDGTLPAFVTDPSRLSYPSSAYDMGMDDDSRNRNGETTVRRGYCNWLLPRTIMIGQYPGMTPEINGPSSRECRRHVRNMVRDANISLFCCLQTEVPSQDDDAGWKGGEVYLEPESVRRQFPRPFARYGPPAQSFAESQLTFVHNPIEDLGVPTRDDALLSLLSRLLGHLEGEDDRAMYLHCWGGRGRAGLVGSCLASLFFPELSSGEILDWVQRGYDTRSGAESMDEGLRRSPQTERQRRFVREFVDVVHAEREDEGMRG